ncbi:hypothetical protein ANN_01164, partial [Periplaneta americana]
WPTVQCLDFDECIVEYYGCYNCKQFICRKSIQFGYNIWSFNTTTGYLINFYVYREKNLKGNVKSEENFGKCAALMVSMLDELPEELKPLLFWIYFDHIFTGVKLLVHLKNCGYGATGTICENRILKDCPLTSSKEMKKKTLMDNSVMTIVSTYHGVQPISNVSRYSQALEKIQ